MPTINQLIRKGREIVEYKSKSRALQSNPQKREFVHVFIRQRLKTKLSTEKGG